MRSQRIYDVQAAWEDYRHLVSESDWEFASPFMYGRTIQELNAPTFRYLTLEEDIADEQELLDDDDGGDPDQARRRYEAGVGDCTVVRDFVTTLVFSRKARERLASVLDATGQLFPVSVEGDEFFIYNCTRLIDAVDREASEIRYVSGERPSQFTRLVFRNERVRNETLFKANWPEPKDSSNSVDYSTIAPPLSIFATQEFVGLVRESKLTGFHFKLVGAEGE